MTEHTDKLGRILKVGDCVATASSNSLMIARIIKITPKMVKVVEIGKKTRWGAYEINKYPFDVIKLDSPDVTIYLLKNE
jgi:hypothetical protein